MPPVLRAADNRPTTSSQSTRQGLRESLQNSHAVDDSEDEGPRQSGIADSQTSLFPSSSSVPSNISEETLERMSNDCVRYFLVSDQKKLPVQRKDIIKNVLKEHPKAYNEVMGRTERKLKEVFGIKLTGLARKGAFILTNQLEYKEEISSLRSPAELAKQGLLFIVLTTIFMCGNVMEEDNLWKMLKKFGISSEVPHELLGDVKKVLQQEFVRQLYLEYKPTAGRDPPCHEFSWGQRALNEVSKMQLLEFVCNVYGDGRKQEDWKSQFEDALTHMAPEESQG